MSDLTLLLIAVGLAVDAFAVAVAVSIALGGASPRQVFRLVFHLGLFQALMPIVGWLCGRTLESAIVPWDHWIAFALLAFIGAKAIYESFSSEASDASRGDPTRGKSLVMLSIATSIDALAVGVSLAFLGVSIWYPSVVIGVVCAALSAIGMYLGVRLGARLGRRAELLGGITLVGIGLHILLSHIGTPAA